MSGMGSMNHPIVPTGLPMYAGACDPSTSVLGYARPSLRDEFPECGGVITWREIRDAGSRVPVPPNDGRQMHSKGAP
jgi:hypothetical protein